MMKSNLIILLSLIISSAFSQDVVTKDNILKDSEGILYYHYPDCSVKPQYPGGDENLGKFISKNLKYPIDAFKNRIEGRVIVKFIIKENGKIGDITILHRLSESTDNEAIRVIKMLKPFKPGKIDRENVRVEFIIPIVFKI